MANETYNQETLFRKIEALETAIAYTIAAISLRDEEIKNEVVTALRRDADDNKELNSANKALNDIVGKIERIKVYPK